MMSKNLSFYFETMLHFIPKRILGKKKLRKRSSIQKGEAIQKRDRDFFAPFNFFFSFSFLYFLLIKQNIRLSSG